MKYCSNKNKKSAFTLIELLISMSIIAVMAVMSIGAYPRFSEQISLSSQTYKMLAYFRETQTYGISAYSTPGVRFVYGFGIDKTTGVMKRYQWSNPTDAYNTSYLDFSKMVAQTDAETITIDPRYEISLIEGVTANSTTTLDQGFVFFKRPNPEGRILGMQDISKYPEITGNSTKSFDRLIVTLRSKITTDFQKKVVILQTGQMYVNDW